MVNFNELKGRLQKFNNTDIFISTIGRFSAVIGLEKCRVMEYINKDIEGLNICNLNNILDDSNPISIAIQNKDIEKFEVIECCGNDEIRIQMVDGEIVIIVGCSV